MRFSWLKNTRFVDLIIIGIFVALSFWMRTQHLQDRLRWDYDRSRDILAGYQIWKYHDLPLVGHHASGFETITSDGTVTVLRYPPAYYYYLSVLWQIGRSINGFLTINALLFALSIGTVYSIGYQLGGRLNGLLAATIFAFSEKHIADSVIIIGLQVGIPLYLLSVSLLLRSLIKKSRILNVVALSLLVLATCFHYSVLIPFIILFFVSEYRFYRNFFHWFISCTCYGIWYVGVFFFIHIPVIAWVGWNEFIYGLLSSSGGASLQVAAGQTVELFFTHFKNVYPLNPTILGTFLVASIFIIATKGSRKTKKLLALICLLTICLLLSGSFDLERYSGQLRAQTELSGLHILFLSTFALSSIVIILKKKRSLLANFLVANLVVICLLSSSNLFSYQSFYPSHYSYRQHSKVTQFIAQHSDVNNLRAFVSSADYLVSGELTLGIFIDQLSSRQVFRFGGYFEDGIVYTNSLAKHAVFVCDLAEIEDRKFCETHLKNYQQNYADYTYLTNGVCFESYQVYWLAQKL